MTALLPNHVHFCRRGHELIFLDLRKDEYTLLTGHEAQAFSSLMPGAENAESVPTDLTRFVDSGLLTFEPSEGRAILPTVLDWPAERIAHLAAHSAARINLKHFTNFAIACSTAAYCLRFQQIERIVRSIEARKEAARRSGIAGTENAEELVATFNKLRGFFPADYLCLFDSVALVHFLARYAVFPTLVFGVRFAPWGAHCWVQDGPLALNDDVETIEDYVPILAV
jgi:hypothetical protein